jgi:hypothetical protein
MHGTTVKKKYLSSLYLEANDLSNQHMHELFK